MELDVHEHLASTVYFVKDFTKCFGGCVVSVLVFTVIYSFVSLFFFTCGYSTVLSVFWIDLIDDMYVWILGKHGDD